MTSSEHGNECLGSIKGRDVLTRGYQLLKDSVIWS
jgi:hypothetical protein